MSDVGVLEEREKVQFLPLFLWPGRTEGRPRGSPSRGREGGRGVGEAGDRGGQKVRWSGGS